VLILGAGETVVSVLLATSLFEHNWLAYTVSWLVCLLVGCGLVLWRGLRCAEGVRGAADWPAAKLAAGCAAVSALHLMTLWNMDTNMRLNLSALRLEAGAMAVAAAPPRPPDHENAAFLYEKAFVLMKRINDTDPGWTSLRQPNKWYSNLNKRDYNVKDPELRRFLKAHEPTLTLLRRAAAMQGCCFERDYAHISLDMQLPELSQLRQSARLLAADARCKAADGQVRAALENVAAIQSISQHLGSEPILISGLVCVAIDSLATETFEGILVSTQPIAADLAALPWDETVSFQRILHRTLVGEEAFGLSAFALLSAEGRGSDAMPRELGFDEKFAGSFPGQLFRVYLLPDDVAGYRRQMREMRDSAAQGFQEAQARFPKLEDEQRAKRPGILSGMLLPVLTHSCQSFARAEARHRLGRLALAVATFRAKTGQLPAKLEGLVPEYIAEVPLDPYDDKPLRLVSHPAGIILYSIGPDLTDDGGTKEFDSATGKGDIVFRIGDVPGKGDK
ncbi:MAG: hypothetical protein ABSE73_17325, partial [Planctomycetota bacterium]